MSGFFLEDKPSTGKRSDGKRKKGAKPNGANFKKLKVKGSSSLRDEDLEDDGDLDEDSDIPSDREEDIAADESEDETAQEKRLRLAKKYLAELEEEERNNADNEEVGEDAISLRLKQDVLEQSGRLQRTLADLYTGVNEESMLVLRGHQLSLTCLCISSDNRHVFTGSKDCSIIKWDIKSGLKLSKISGHLKSGAKNHKCHQGHVLALAVSSDGKYLASGGHDKCVQIWNSDTLEHVHTFRGHRDTISGLSFRKGSHQLFSSSCDRSVKIWNLDEMAYVETLFGHQDSITGIDSMYRDRAVTSGGRDRSLRIWKVSDESQLVFNTTGGSVDCVQFINEEFFISGSDNGSLCVWSVNKKKPICSVPEAHKKPEGGESRLIPGESWITAVACLKNSDLIASGSCDGCIRLWKCGEGFKSLSPLFTIPVEGFVNCLMFSSDGNYLLAGVGQEHKLGRWWTLKHARNSLRVFPLVKRTQAE